MGLYGGFIGRVYETSIIDRETVTPDGCRAMGVARTGWGLEAGSGIEPLYTDLQSVA